MIQIVENKLDEKIFTILRRSGPFVEYQEEDITEALKNTLYSVVLYDEDTPIGMARMVGDNRIAFFIKDVVILPEYQGKGLGNLLMKQLFKYLNKVACENAYVGLMSTPHVEGFYEKYGFIRRPNEKYGAGMVLYYKRGMNA